MLTETNRFGTWQHNYQFGSEVWSQPVTTTDPLGRVTRYYRTSKHMQNQTENGVAMGRSVSTRVSHG